MNTDELLEQLAKALNNETYKLPEYIAVGITEMTIQPTTEQLTDETGTRVATTCSRATNTVTCSGIRSGTNVVDTVNGDDIRSIGFFNESVSDVGDKLLTGVSINGLIQTTNFDIETVLEYTINRR